MKATDLKSISHQAALIPLGYFMPLDMYADKFVIFVTSVFDRSTLSTWFTHHQCFQYLLHKINQGLVLTHVAMEKNEKAMAA